MTFSIDLSRPSLSQGDGNKVMECWSRPSFHHPITPPLIGVWGVVMGAGGGQPSRRIGGEGDGLSGQANSCGAVRAIFAGRRSLHVRLHDACNETCCSRRTGQAGEGVGRLVSLHAAQSRRLATPHPISARRRMSSTRGIQPGPSAFAASITSWLRLMLTVRLLVPRGLPRLRLGWLVMSEQRLVARRADRVVRAVGERGLRKLGEIVRVHALAMVGHEHLRRFRLARSVADHVRVAGAVVKNRKLRHRISPPLSGEAPDRHPLPMNIHYSEKCRDATAIALGSSHFSLLRIGGW